MLSALQRQKLEHFFGVFDTDHDGYLERSDFESLVQNLAAVRGASPGSPDYDDLHSLWMMVWDQLEKESDVNRDDIVSPDEWCNLADQILSSGDGYATVMNAIGLRTFDQIDGDGDGEITPDEWAAFYAAHEIDRAAADEVFEQFDTDHDGRLSREETMDRLHEFFNSDDPSAPGNSFFGRLPQLSERSS